MKKLEQNKLEQKKPESTKQVDDIPDDFEAKFRRSKTNRRYLRKARVQKDRDKS